MEINHYWTKLNVGCGTIMVLRNQNIQLTVEDDLGSESYIDLSNHEAKAISDMLLLSIGELSEEEFKQKYNK